MKPVLPLLAAFTLIALVGLLAGFAFGLSFAALFWKN